MYDLTLRPGPDLVFGFPETRDGKTTRGTANVTSDASRFLFHVVRSEPGVTLNDILLLLDTSPALVDIFRLRFAGQIREEVLKGPPAQAAEGGESPRVLEHLELRWNWRLDTGTREYSSVHELELSGVGPALRDDDAQQNLKAGDRERWSLKLMPEDAAFATMFETLGNVTQAEVRRVMRDIDDDQAASIEFSAAFGDRVRVRQQHQQLTGRQFRKTFHAAR